VDAITAAGSVTVRTFAMARGRDLHSPDIGIVDRARIGHPCRTTSRMRDGRIDRAFSHGGKGLRLAVPVSHGTPQGIAWEKTSSRSVAQATPETNPVFESRRAVPRGNGCA